MNEKGGNITKAFKFIQNFYSEIAQLFTKLDDLMEREGWKSARGNTTTSVVSKDLQRPKQWLPDGSFRLYENDNFPNERRGVTVGYVHDEIKEPIIIIGKVTYKDLNEAEDWDLWKLWFDNKQPMILNKDITSFDSENEKLSERIGPNTCIHAINLVDLAKEEDIKGKILNKLLKM